MASTNSPSCVGVNIYTASEGELRTIPGVGKIISRAILKLRGEVPVVTRELLRNIPMLRGNNDFLAIIDLDKPKVQSPSTPPPMQDLSIWGKRIVSVHGRLRLLSIAQWVTNWTNEKAMARGPQYVIVISAVPPRI